MRKRVPGRAYAKELSKGVEELFGQLFAIVVGAAIGYWYCKVDRSDVSPFKASLFYFSVAIGFIFQMSWYAAETTKIFCGGFASHCVFIAVVHLVTNDSEKYQRKASGWVDGMLGLIAVTDVLMLVLDYSNTKPILNPRWRSC